ncbi:MAG: S41 family peptidase [bacterium]
MNIDSPAKIRAKKYAGIYLSVILFIISFGLGLVIGKTWFVKEQISNDRGEVEISKVVGLNRSLNKSDSVDFELFWDVWDKINKKYAKEEFKEVDMFYGALQGMVMSLGDPYSIFMPPKMALEFSKDISGELEGIGCEMGIKEGQLVVISPLPDSPAEKAGLRPGDKVLSINGTSTFGMGIMQAVNLIRGKADTEVVLGVRRNGDSKTQDIKIIRAKIDIPAILYSVKNNNVAYLRVMQFNGSTASELDKYAKQISNNKFKSVILDLRGNPGGYLQSAVSVSGQWVDKDQIVVSQKNKNQDTGNLKSQGPSRLKGLKTIVLVNRGSASASEIVAGALQDYGLAVIMGETTFGKGSVQDFQTFTDGSALKLTVAEWFTPNGKNINESGVMPDIEIKEDWIKQDVGEDEMLDQALKLFASSTFKW